MNRRGAVLITSLWTLIILSMLALGLAYRVRLELALTRRQLDAIALVQMAKAALTLSRPSLAADEGYWALNQPWSTDPASFKDRDLMGGRLSWTHAAEGPSGPPAVLYGLADEESRLSLNSAPAEALARLPGIGRDVAEAIVEWRSPGASAAAGNYVPRGGPFRSVDELLLVRGMTGEDFELAAPYLTACGSGRVNVNTAPRRVLLAAGLSEEAAAKVLLYRAGPDLQAGTADDGLFRNAASIAADLARSTMLSEAEFRSLSAAQPLLGVRSSCFRATVNAERGSFSRVFTTVFSKGSEAPLYWHEGA